MFQFFGIFTHLNGIVADYFESLHVIRRKDDVCEKIRSISIDVHWWFHEMNAQMRRTHLNYDLIYEAGYFIGYSKESTT